MMTRIMVLISIIEILLLNPNPCSGRGLVADLLSQPGAVPGTSKIILCYY
jgi:hypothetical protein